VFWVAFFFAAIGLASLRLWLHRHALLLALVLHAQPTGQTGYAPIR
jgi:hypothetical protein